MKLREIVCMCVCVCVCRGGVGGVDWIIRTQEKEQWLASFNKVMTWLMALH